MPALNARNMILGCLDQSGVDVSKNRHRKNPRRTRAGMPLDKVTRQGLKGQRNGEVNRAEELFLKMQKDRQDPVL